MYNKFMLAKQVNLFNQKTKQTKDYEIGIKQTGDKKVPYQIFMICEDGDKHKFAGTSKECFNYLDNILA